MSRGALSQVGWIGFGYVVAYAMLLYYVPWPSAVVGVPASMLIAGLLWSLPASLICLSRFDPEIGRSAHAGSLFVISAFVTGGLWKLLIPFPKTVWSFGLMAVCFGVILLVVAFSTITELRTFVIGYTKTTMRKL
jgi:hypothetical protein